VAARRARATGRAACIPWLRAGVDRAAFFAEIRRVLEPAAPVVLVEHLRDLQNLIAYGPGALHFLSRRAWLEAAESAGFVLRKERRINALVRAFVFVAAQPTA
jgi:hypothetical protein